MRLTLIFFVSFVISTLSYASPGSFCSPGNHMITMPMWPARPYEIHVPPGNNCSKPLPVLLALHGGGLNGKNMHWLMCPSGDLQDADCLDGISNREQFIVVYPNGTSCWPNVPEARGWNDGDVGACPNDIDDVKYFTDLLGDISQKVSVDQKRIYSTGVSNGGGMSHKLACDLSNKIAAIAPVAGGNQEELNHSCHPNRPVPVLEIHGTADQFWPYLGGAGDNGNNPTYKVNIPSVTVGGWVKRNHCNPQPVRSSIPKRVVDGTYTELDRYLQCDRNSQIAFLTVFNGGHTWPGENRTSTVKFGLVSHDFNASEVIWNFLKNWRLP